MLSSEPGNNEMKLTINIFNQCKGRYRQYRKTIRRNKYLNKIFRFNRQLKLFIDKLLEVISKYSKFATYKLNM